MIQITQMHLAMLLGTAAIAAFGVGLVCGVLLLDWLNTRYEQKKKDYLNAPTRNADATIRARANTHLKAIK